MWEVFALPILLCWSKEVAEPDPRGVCFFPSWQDSALSPNEHLLFWMTQKMNTAYLAMHGLYLSVWFFLPVCPEAPPNAPLLQPRCEQYGLGGFAWDSVSSPVFWTWGVLRDDPRTSEILGPRGRRNSDHRGRWRKKKPVEQQLNPCLRVL